MILLDTNALLWLETNHSRTRALVDAEQRLFVSPASLLELQFLVDVGKVRFRRKGGIDKLVEDERWTVDEPPALRWFEDAMELSWTRDPFDRLIAAHARVRGWRLATADATILEHLPPKQTIEL